MGSLLTLAARVDRIAARVHTEGVKPVNAAVMAMVRYLVEQTPVDTSRALSNWQVSLGVPFGFELPPYLPGERGSTVAASSQETIKAAEYLLSLRRIGTRVFLSNNAPYIKRLNEGYSAQNAGGFVQRAVMVGREYSKSVRLLTNV